MSYSGVPVRVYALVLNENGEVLVSDAGALPKSDYSAGKDFRENVLECVRTQTGLRPTSLKLAGLAREHGADSAMAVAFWAEQNVGTLLQGWKFVVPQVVIAPALGFESSLVDACFRSRPAVWVL